MQVSDEAGTASLDQLIDDAMPDRRGFDAWRTFLRAHASLMRALTADLAERTGLTLGDFDALAQLALADGELRMTDLAARAFSSRSGMTRRVDRLVADGLVGRCGVETDARSVVISLTDAGRARLAETLPVHLGEVARLFSEPLDDDELRALERTLGKVTVDCSFG